MKYQKSFDHLLVDAPTPSAHTEPAPVKTARPAEAFGAGGPPADYHRPKTSLIPRLIIVALVVLIIYLVYSLLPRTFDQCSRFPGSRLSSTLPATCRTFYGAQYSQTPTPAPLSLNEMLGVTPRPTSSLNQNSELASPELDLDTPTTKGGLPLTTPTPRKTTPPSTGQPVNQTSLVPTSAPTTTDIGKDWVKHRYPDQQLALWLPKGWTGSDATKNLTTNITTFSLGGDSLQVRLEPSWNNYPQIKNTAINYEVKGLAAIKVVGSATTTVYFERNQTVYVFACHNSIWGTCHTILQNLEFQN